MPNPKGGRSSAARQQAMREANLRLGAAGLPSVLPAESRLGRRRARVRLRALPLMLLAVFFLFSAKIGTVWQNFSQASGVSVANQAQAQSAAHGSPLAIADAKNAPPAAEMPRDPTRFSQSEIDLLQALAARRDQLDRREKDLDQRETLLQAAEKR